MASKGKASVRGKSDRMRKYEDARQAAILKFEESDNMTTTALATALLLIDIEHGMAMPDAVTVASWRGRRGEVSRKRVARGQRG